MGCGWVRATDGGGGGAVYFTLNGARQAGQFTDAPAEMIPFIHLQKKVRKEVEAKLMDKASFVLCKSVFNYIYM